MTRKKNGLTAAQRKMLDSDFISDDVRDFIKDLPVDLDEAADFYKQLAQVARGALESEMAVRMLRAERMLPAAEVKEREKVWTQQKRDLEAELETTRQRLLNATAAPALAVSSGR